MALSELPLGIAFLKCRPLNLLTEGRFYEFPRLTSDGSTHAPDSGSLSRLTRPTPSISFTA